MDPAIVVRLVIGIPFVYLVSGFPLARLFLRQEKTVSLKLVIAAFAFSCFLTYPAAVLTTILEGQSGQAIYQVHLSNSLFSLSVLFLITFLLLVVRNGNWYRLSLPKFTRRHFLLFLIVVVFAVLVFGNIPRADVMSDEYDLGYQAYNLHDGIMAGRKAFVVSFSTHPPLAMTIKHFGMQLFSPWGLASLSDGMFRGVEGLMGIGIILAVYLLVRDFISARVAMLAALLLAVNNYLVFLGRIFLREIYLLFFLVVSAYFFLGKNVSLAAFFLGSAFLVKSSALPLAVVFFVVLLWKGEIKSLGRLLLVLGLTGLPVVLFNVGSYLTTGQMDATFSQIFGRYHPFATAASGAVVDNLITVFYLLADLNSWLVFVFILVGLTFVLKGGLRPSLAARLLVLWTFFELVFFVFGPLRAYYLLSLTIPLVIFLGVFLERMVRKTRWGWVVVAVIAVFSFGYSYNSNLVVHRLPLSYGDVGAGGDYRLLKDNFWHGTYSLAASVFHPDQGWKNLSLRLVSLYQPGDCLSVERKISDLPLRHYLGIKDRVKEAFLGANYYRKFLWCEDTLEAQRVIYIHYDREGMVNLTVAKR